ncbi:UbiA prenyltransferase family protein [uncultured Candidatus Thioglobus sp.]|nr:UbiA prenyltransferase family protein [uncultured Candidatus Thioglobus sp.]
MREFTGIPLVVDLDHTLIDTDLLQQSSKGVLKKSPWLIIKFPFWLMKGKGYLKEQLVKRFDINVTALPYNQTTIDYIKQRKQEGNLIVLATASHKRYAFKVAEYLKTEKTKGKHKTSKNHELFATAPQTTQINTGSSLFDDVMASNASFNLSSQNKADKLIERFGKGGFDYIGDHRRDLPVWEASNMAILVNVSKRTIRKTKHLKVLTLSTKN